MALLKRKSQIAVEIEGTEGTKETLEGADVFLGYNQGFEPEIEPHERDISHSYLSPHPSLMGKKSGRITFDVEMVGPGSAGAAIHFSDALQACGVDETLSTDAKYTPLSDAVPSVTVGWYHDGKAYRIWGARGNAVLNMELGKPGIFSMSFLGADWEEVDVALFTSGVSYEDTKPPVLLGATLSIDSYAVKIGKLSLDLGCVLTLRTDSSKDSGHFSTVISSRKPIITFDPEDVLVATEDFLGNWESGAEMAFSAAIGSGTGNTFTITAPKVQYQGVTISEREGVLVKELVGLCCLSSGDDEWQIAIT